MKEKDIQRATSQIVEDVIDKANLKQGAIFVLGLSSSEVIGGQIGPRIQKHFPADVMKLFISGIFFLIGFAMIASFFL